MRLLFFSIFTLLLNSSISQINARDIKYFNNMSAKGVEGYLIASNWEFVERRYRDWIKELNPKCGNETIDLCDKCEDGEVFEIINDTLNERDRIYHYDYDLFDRTTTQFITLAKDYNKNNNEASAFIYITEEEESNNLNCSKSIEKTKKKFIPLGSFLRIQFSSLEEYELFRSDVIKSFEYKGTSYHYGDDKPASSLYNYCDYSRNPSTQIGIRLTKFSTYGLVDVMYDDSFSCYEE